MNSMIKHLVICLLVFIWIPVFSQNGPDTTINQAPPDCEAIALNSTSWIMFYYSVRDIDSAYIVLDNWQSACGLSEPILRTRILLDIRNNTFTESMYDSTIVDILLNYMMRMDTSGRQDMFSRYPEYFGYVPLRSDYDYFTQSIADSLLNMIFYNPAALLFVEIYSNVLPDPVKTILQDTNFTSTTLRSYYSQRVDKYMKKPDFHYSLYTGMWIPTGNASLLGVHPVIGIQAGMRKQKMTYNLTFDVKVGKSKNEYTIFREGNLETTNTFMGFFVGFDAERELYSFRKNKISLLGGIGYDGFDTVKVNTEDEDPNNDKSHMVSSFNTNFGLVYRHFFANQTYLGLQGRYNFVNYNNTGGTNFSGNTISISVALGGFFNDNKSYNLKELRYSE
jgi:hypothetical protein